MKKIIYSFIAVAVCLLLCFFADSDTEISTEQPPTQLPVSSQLPTSEPEIEIEYTKTQTAKKEIAATKEPETILPEPTPEPEAADELTCTLAVRCDSVLENIELLSDAKRKILPEDGMIYPERKVEFYEGESVFDVLLRELGENEIHLEFVKTPMYNSAYVEGIGNLYEFDCGDMSGWKYSVNGEKPTQGCSQYMVKKGDRIVFYYTINYLKD